MTRRSFAALLLAVLVAAPARRGASEGLDWEVREAPDAPAPVRALRNVRDGMLGLVDAFVDANSGLFGELALGLGKGLMAASDLVGLVDDNAVTEHVTRSVLSKPLAKTAYLWHVAGAESVLGGHGLEKERWAAEDLAGLNPLLTGADVEAVGGPLPLEPLDFVGEGLVHPRVYRTHSVVLGTGAVVVADGVLRPAGAVLRILQLRRPADALERRATELVRGALRLEW